MQNLWKKEAEKGQKKPYCCIFMQKQVSVLNIYTVLPVSQIDKMQAFAPTKRTKAKEMHQNEGICFLGTDDADK